MAEVSHHPGQLSAGAPESQVPHPKPAVASLADLETLTLLPPIERARRLRSPVGDRCPWTTVWSRLMPLDAVPDEGLDTSSRGSTIHLADPGRGRARRRASAAGAADAEVDGGGVRADAEDEGHARSRYHEEKAARVGVPDVLRLRARRQAQRAGDRAVAGTPGEGDAVAPGRGM